MNCHIIYCIAGIAIKIEVAHCIEQTEGFELFRTENETECYRARVIVVDSLPEIKRNPIVKSNEYKVYPDGDGYLRCFHDHDKENESYAIARWDWDSRTITVNHLPEGKRFFSQSGNTLFHLGLEMIMLRENRLIFHAACVDTHLGGILFTGPSGAGKSTQADLWVKYREAVLINGDRPILSKEKNGWLAWGSPYAGSSRCYVNDNCSVKAIVSVVKDSENKVIRIKGGRAFSVVFSGITVNDWSREDVNMASELVIELIKSVPVYELHCTNTEEAVEVLEKVLKGEMIL